VPFPLFSPCIVFALSLVGRSIFALIVARYPADTAFFTTSIPYSLGTSCQHHLHHHPSIYLSLPHIRFFHNYSSNLKHFRFILPIVFNPVTRCPSTPPSFKMLFQSSLVLLAITSVQATAVLVQRAPELESRAVSQGWSLQSSSAPSSLHSCGNGAYCPISLHCNSMVNNHQVAACCTSGT